MSLSESSIPALRQAERYQSTARFVIFLAVILIVVAILLTIIYLSVYAKQESVDIDPFD